MRPIFLLLTLAYCGHPPVLRTTGFEQYIEYFEQMSYDRNRPTDIKDLIVEFGDVRQFGENRVGMAWWGGNKTPLIWIDKEFWDYSNVCRRLSLMMHELGHAIYGYQHRDNVKSVMNSYVVLDFCEHEDYYLDEFYRFGFDDYKPLEIQEFMPSGHLSSDDCGLGGV
jgi:hypothetical protein